jgi:DNA-binding CsgD family transcriptional regulator
MQEVSMTTLTGRARPPHPSETGLRHARRAARERPRFGWDSLTPAELSVAALVAEGLSNPQIGQRYRISRRTVQAHLAHIFAKLDISSRAQLAAEVTRQAAGVATPGDRAKVIPR